MLVLTLKTDAAPLKDVRWFGSGGKGFIPRGGAFEIKVQARGPFGQFESVPGAASKSNCGFAGRLRTTPP